MTTILETGNFCEKREKYIDHNWIMSMISTLEEKCIFRTFENYVAATLWSFFLLRGKKNGFLRIFTRLIITDIIVFKEILLAN